MRLRAQLQTFAHPLHWGLRPYAPIWDDSTMNRGPAIHWMNAGGAACGAPAGSFLSPYPHAVTCRECVISLKVDLLQRRLDAYRHSVLSGKAPRATRRKSGAERA